MFQVETTGNWKTKVLLIGATLGAAVGLGTAYLMVRTAEENDAGPPKIKTGDALKAGVNIVGLVRGIAALAGR
ncbi:MAG: hypothetical protein GY803_13145 [Chloroflexi bacterium]|nr:hypothetical protein [Chloroflexota bacterium]